MKKVNIGIQLFSVREEIKEYGLDAVLSALKEAGCTAVEFAGFYDLPPMEFADILRQCRNNGATLLGGCCGTDPRYIAAVAQL